MLIMKGKAFDLRWTFGKRFLSMIQGIDLWLHASDKANGKEESGKQELGYQKFKKYLNFKVVKHCKAKIEQAKIMKF